MTPASVESLIAEIEREDRIDFGDLAIGEADARRLMATHFCDVDRQLAEQGVDADGRLEIMAAIAAHTMVENMILHLRRLRSAASQQDFDAWRRRHGIG